MQVLMIVITYMRFMNSKQTLNENPKQSENKRQQLFHMLLKPKPLLKGFRLHNVLFFLRYQSRELIYIARVSYLVIKCRKRLRDRPAFNKFVVATSTNKGGK